MLIYNYTFWLGVLVPIIFALLSFLLIYYYWSKDSEVVLSAEAIRNPINIGITVASVIIPLIVSLMSYLFTQNHSNLYEFSFLIASIVVFIFSVILGLYNLVRHEVA